VLLHVQVAGLAEDIEMDAWAKPMATPRAISGSAAGQWWFLDNAWRTGEMAATVAWHLPRQRNY
jgi:hypothetical protein